MVEDMVFNEIRCLADRHADDIVFTDLHKVNLWDLVDWLGSSDEIGSHFEFGIKTEGML